MFPIIKRALSIMAVFSVFMCVSSCMSLTSTPKAPDVEGPSSPTEPLRTSGNSASLNLDDRLIDTWELMYQVDENGKEKRPKPGTRTLMEFTKNGEVIVNRVDGTSSDTTKTRRGTYAISGDEIVIADDMGKSERWPYEISEDTLTTVMPKARKKFYWRRFRFGTDSAPGGMRSHRD